MPAHEPSTASRPGPHVLVDSSATAIAGCGSILLIAASAGLIFAVAAGSTLAIIVLGLVVVLGAIGLGAALVEQRRWEPLELRFPTWPLPLGSAPSVEVIRRARQTVPDADYELTAQLTCTERVTYTSGKETHTESDDVYERTVRGAGSLRSNTFVGRLDLHIPLDAGAPTVDLVLDVPSDAPISYHGSLIQIRWEIEARTDIRMAIDQRSTASVLVVPVGGLGIYDRPHPLINGEKSGSEPEAL